MRTFFKNRYRIVLEKGGKMHRKEIYDHFPYEVENMNQGNPFIQLKHTLDEIIKTVTGNERKANTGFGFSQTEGQTKILNEKYNS
jgi:hypothetical protein